MKSDLNGFIKNASSFGNAYNLAAFLALVQYGLVCNNGRRRMNVCRNVGECCSSVLFHSGGALSISATINSHRRKLPWTLNSHGLIDHTMINKYPCKR